MAESPIQSSFIPRDASSPSVTKVPRGGLYDLLMLVSVVLFIASVVLAIGVYLYVQFLQSESASKLQQLQRAEAAFEPSLIQQLTRLDDRMHSADDLIAAHIAPTALLAVLEEATLQTVSFKSFQFDATDPQHLTLKMSGIAQSVNSIALQADLFSKSNIITNPIFSGIARQPDGVVFSVSALVNPASIRYASLVGGGSNASTNTSGNSAQSASAAGASPFTGTADSVTNPQQPAAAPSGGGTGPGASTASSPASAPPSAPSSQQ